MTKAMSTLFDSAADLEFEDVMLLTDMLRAVMTGVTRTVFEQNASPAKIRKMHMELRIMCQAYVQAIGIARTTPISGKNARKHAT